MGFYRLILAFLVALSHAGLRVGAFNPGLVASISFFMLSGYVMTALIDRHYGALNRVGAFYVDRALRLYPQFLFYSLATIVAAERFGLRHPWLTAPPSLPSDLVQLTMAPLNCGPCFSQMLIPQAWSLGLEVIFYAAFPFVLIPGRRLPTAVCSAAVFTLAYCGRLSPDWFTYRLLMGNFFVFILGSWLRRPEPQHGRLAIFGFLAFAGLGLTLAQTIWPHRASISDVFVGVLIGLPAIYALARLRVGGKADAAAGDLTYGVFLNHNLLIPVIHALAPGASLWLVAAILLPLSTALSYVTFRLFEAPVLALRRGLRDAPARKPEMTTAAVT